MGYVSPDNVFMGLSELERQIGILETLVAQERPQQREQWRRYVRPCNSPPPRERAVTPSPLEHPPNHTTSTSPTLSHTHGRKIAELGNEAAFLRSVLQRFLQSRTRAQREEKEREELLARRYEVGGVGGRQVCVMDVD